MRRFLGAVQFLTVVPVPLATCEPGRAAVFFPLVGALVGAAAAGVYLAAAWILPVPVAAATVLAFEVWVTGALHEDGLADCADAFRAGRTPARVLAILKDSRIGSYGGVALSLALLIRWTCLAALAPPNLLPALVASLAVPRAAMVVLAWLARPAGSGLGAGFAESLSTVSALLAGLQGIAAAIWCGPLAAVLMLAAMFALIRLARWYFELRLGGVNGDCLGAVCQVGEILVLLCVLCHVST